MGTYSDADRMIILSKLEEYELANQLNQSSSSSLPPLTTVFYPDDQISAYHHMLASTTPLSAKKRISTNKSINSAAANVYPSNHRRGYSKMYRNHNFVTTDVMERTVAPTTIAETKHIEFPQKRMFLPTLDDYDNDFIDVSYPKANNIQDILNQSTDDDEIGSVGGSVGGVGVGDMINDLILPSMPFMKVEGTYRREKMKRDQLSTMESAIQTAHMHAPARTHSKNVQHKFDQFSKFKPSSPSDVNLLATSNAMKFKPYTHSKPRPLTTPPMPMNKFSYGDHYGSNSDPNLIYHQIISANRNGRFEKLPPINDKPFSLMLDVYPMPGEELSQQQILHAKSTRMTPFAVPNPPIYPVNSHTINNNLQYNKDLTMHNPFRYPQLQPYPYNRSPYALNPTAKEGYMQNYVMQRMNMKGPLSRRSITSGDEMPSQITVHLNLYPDRKRTRNVEIVNTEPVADRDLTTTIATISSAANANTMWKRLEHPTNSTITKLIDSMRTSRFQLIKPPYIPPFSAIKIDSIQHALDNTGSASTLFPHVKPLTTDKTIDYDLMTFDSKPMANSITSSTPQSILENALPSMSISSDTLASTMSNQFASTMSSSTTATAIPTPSFYTTPNNQIPLISTNTPLHQTTTPIISTTTDDSNETKFDQTSTTTYGI